MPVTEGAWDCWSRKFLLFLCIISKAFIFILVLEFICKKIIGSWREFQLQRVSLNWPAYKSLPVLTNCQASINFYNTFDFLSVFWCNVVLFAVFNFQTNQASLLIYLHEPITSWLALSYFRQHACCSSTIQM